MVEELGSDAFVYGTSGVEGTPSNVIVRVSARDTVHKGDVFHVTTDPHQVHVFDAETRGTPQRLNHPPPGRDGLTVRHAGVGSSTGY